MEDNSNKDKWDYSRISTVCYADPLNQYSYYKPAEFLGNGQVEDWGGGTGWAKRFFTDYTNIDGSQHKNVDIIADLVEYTSDCDNILMREVLEYNTEWKTILNNVKVSFRKKFCLVISTPFVDETSVGYISPTGIKEHNFKKTDILNEFPASDYKVIEETVKTNHLYGQDWILYVERISS